ncbi:MAG TPA: histidine phosphatase family protein [Rhodocyclaceae bacterium]|nr:histidine phosphatase family protein [Rhodocyclaceae bacterium]
MSSTRICIVRHGETDWNADERIQGQTDIPLNAVGCAQAQAVASGLASERFAVLYSSDLQRARDTATVTAQILNLPLQLEPGLRERRYGEYEGLTREEIKQRGDYGRYITRDLDFDFCGGESLQTFAERVENTIGRLAKIHAGQSILIFTHGGVLDIVYRVAMHQPLDTKREFPIPNAALNWISVGNDERNTGWTVLSWAVQSHLAATRELTVE